mmetsp:Transcript_8922/g.23349  ORF Transcript_8922/g.23349 Transcript_8922/m.23349 type:complete len:257 (-) Transcript_8922:1312-2082(-)
MHLVRVVAARDSHVKVVECLDLAHAPAVTHALPPGRDHAVEPGVDEVEPLERLLGAVHLHQGLKGRQVDKHDGALLVAVCNAGLARLEAPRNWQGNDGMEELPLKVDRENKLPDRGDAPREVSEAAPRRDDNGDEEERRGDQVVDDGNGRRPVGPWQWLLGVAKHLGCGEGAVNNGVVRGGGRQQGQDASQEDGPRGVRKDGKGGQGPGRGRLKARVAKVAHKGDGRGEEEEKEGHCRGSGGDGAEGARPGRSAGT